jgi:hypothetical protein
LNSAEGVREDNKEVEAAEETLKGFENGTTGEAGKNASYQYYHEPLFCGRPH